MLETHVQSCTGSGRHGSLEAKFLRLNRGLRGAWHGVRRRFEEGGGVRAIAGRVKRPLDCRCLEVGGDLGKVRGRAVWRRPEVGGCDSEETEETGLWRDVRDGSQCGPGALVGWWFSWMWMAGPKGDWTLHGPGIEPGPPAWQARILPLNHPCADEGCHPTVPQTPLPSPPGLCRDRPGARKQCSFAEASRVPTVLASLPEAGSKRGEGPHQEARPGLLGRI